MLFDVRTYTCRPGAIRKQMELYLEKGWAAQRRHLGEPLFYGTCETGDPNQYVHIWVYENAGDREKKRAAMQADPDWQAYVEASAEAGWLIEQGEQADGERAVLRIERQAEARTGAGRSEGLTRHRVGPARRERDHRADLLRSCLALGGVGPRVRDHPMRAAGGG